MKKTIIALALLVAGAGLAKAQTVVPIVPVFIQVPFDSIRAEFPERLAYIAELKRVDQELIQSQAKLDELNRQFKDEQQHFKNVTAFIKDRTKQLSTLEKSYNGEKKVQDSYMKLIEKHRQAASKVTLIDRASRDTYMDELNNLKQVSEMYNVSYKQQMENINSEYELLKAQQINLAQFEIQLKSKEAELKQMQATLKNNQAAVKNAIKSEEAILKAQQ